MSKLDTRNLNSDEIIASDSGQNVWVSAEVDEKVYFLLDTSQEEPTYVPAAVIKFSEPCLTTKRNEYVSFQDSLLMFLSSVAPQITGVWNPPTGVIYSVVGVPVINGGSEYTNATVTIDPPPEGGITATAIAEIGANKTVSAIIITNKGTGYKGAPNIEITGDGTGAQLGPAILSKIPEAICGEPTGNFEGFNSNVDANLANRFGYFPEYVSPNCAAIPIRSNIRTYGPYISSNFANDYGGIDVETDTDIAPWVFGSISAANFIGSSRANQFTDQPLKISETGSATVFGLPSLSFGQRLNTGPYINNVNMTFGKDGIRTTLNFQTFTPKYGSLQPIYSETLKNSIKTRQKQLQFLRNQSITSQKINRSLARIKNANTNNNTNHRQPAKKPSLQRVLVGESYDWQKLKVIPELRPVQASGQRLSVGIDTLADAAQEMRYDYERKAYISLDAVYSPVSISGGNGFLTNPSSMLPRYIIPNTGDGEDGSSYVKHFASPIHPHPPFTTGNCEEPVVSGHTLYNLQIHNLYLNPLANPSGIPHYSGTCAGHNIDLVGKGTEVPETGILASFYTEEENDQKYFDDYRFLAMRGPLVLHSWGYDVDGKPIPNYIDTEDKAKSGVFVTSVSGPEPDAAVTGLTDWFMQDWLQKPNSWPVGPIDLRFDRERGVWVSPQPYKIVVAEVVASVGSFGAGVGAVINEYEAEDIYGRQLSDASGNILSASGCSQNIDTPPVCLGPWVLTNMTAFPTGNIESNDAYVLDVGTTLSLDGAGLCLTKERVYIPGIKKLGPGTGGTSCVGTTDCPGPPPTVGPTATPTPTPTPTPETPTPTPTPTPTLYPPTYLENCCPSAKVGGWIQPRFIMFDSYEEGETPPLDLFTPDYVFFVALGNYQTGAGAIGCYKTLDGPPCSYILNDNSIPKFQWSPNDVTFIGLGSDGCEFCYDEAQYLASISPIECVASTGDVSLIKLVDRIGNSYSVGQLVYGYYDTYRSEYLVLGARTNPTTNPTVFGSVKFPDAVSADIEYVPTTGELTIEGISTVGGADIGVTIGDTIKVINVLQYRAKSNEKLRGVAQVTLLLSSPWNAYT